MERKLQERMVGAGVLVVALVILGPFVLDGGSNGSDDVDEPIPGQRSDELGTQTFRLTPPSASSTADAPRPVARTAPPATSAVPVETPDTPTPAAQRRAQPSAPPVAAIPAPAAIEPASPAVQPVESRPAEVTPRPAPAAPFKAPTPRPAPTATPAGGGFVVQVGTFGQKDNAARLVTSLKQKGFAAVSSPLTRAGKTMYRVRVGPSGSRDAAAVIAKRLAAQGQAGQVVAE